MNKCSRMNLMKYSSLVIKVWPSKNKYIRVSIVVFGKIVSGRRRRSVLKTDSRRDHFARWKYRDVFENAERERERERKRKRGASSCRSVLRFDVGNHAPHSPSAAEIFGFIVCEGLSPGRGVLSWQEKEKPRGAERGRVADEERGRREQEEEEGRGRADGGGKQGEAAELPADPSFVSVEANDAKTGVHCPQL